MSVTGSEIEDGLYTSPQANEVGAPTPEAQAEFLSQPQGGSDLQGNPCSPLGYGCYPDGSGGTNAMEGADSKGRWDADNLDQEASDLLREQWGQYKDMYTPIMQNLNDMVGNKNYANEQAATSRERGMAAGVSSQMQTGRDIDRYGIGMTANQRDQVQNTGDLNTTAGAVQGSNSSRMSMYNHRLAVMTDMAAAGHGVQGQAMSGLATASQNANMTANNLQQQTVQAQQAKSSRNSQIAGAVVSMAAMALL